MFPKEKKHTIKNEKRFFMQDKKNFGKYLYEKRKQRELTQEELAKKLYVLPSTISKWERGITYPDITLIPKLCKELNISEHEFFTSCDDFEKEREKRELNKYHKIQNCVLKGLSIGYILGVLICPIVNYCIDKELSWSWIAMFGILLAWTITNVPFVIKKKNYKGIKIATMITVEIILLLWVIQQVTKGDWFWKSLIIATYVLFFFWISIFVCTFSKINIKKKISISLVLMAIVTITTNPLSQKVLEITETESNIPNVLCAIIMVISSLCFWFHEGKKS